METTLSIEMLVTYLLIGVPAAAVLILGAYRLTRVVIYDAFPPAAWLRSKWDDLTYDEDEGDYNSWNKLLHCPWCFTPWVVLVGIGWFFLGWFVAAWIAWAWWLFWGWLAMAGLSSMVYVRDERPEPRG